MEENIQAEALQDEIEEKKVYSSFENYTKKQVTLIGYLLGIKEFHITNPPFDQAYLQKIKGTKEIEIIRALSILRLNFIYAYDKIYREKQTKGPFAQFDKMEQMIDAEALHYKAVIEEFAYTWFNRFVALRFMETHDFLPHGFRVLSSRDGNLEPEILKNLAYVKDELKLDINLCNALKTQGKLEELYRYVLFRQCKALSGILPMLFSDENDYLELLLPKILLKGETVLTRLLEIPEEAFLQDVEIIGWMYQFYISVKKDEVFASKKTITKDTLPAVTQLFTPDWIVRYMAENSIGRIWIESYPNSSLKSDMKYYVADPEQTQEIKRKIDAVKYQNVRPEDIKVIEPCCGSGHILVYVFDLLFKMYEEKGYQPREIPSLILKNNIFGLDVDKRASQLASFALIMKARSLNSKFFSESYYVAPYVYEICN